MNLKNIEYWNKFLQNELYFSCTQPVEIYSIFCALRSGGIDFPRDWADEYVERFKTHGKIFVGYQDPNALVCKFIMDSNEKSIAFTKEIYKDTMSYIKSTLKLPDLKGKICKNNIRGEENKMENWSPYATVNYDIAGQITASSMPAHTHNNCACQGNVYVNKENQEREENKMENSFLKRYFESAINVINNKREEEIEKIKNEDPLYKLKNVIKENAESMVEIYNRENDTAISLDNIMGLYNDKLSENTGIKINKVMQEFQNLMAQLEKRFFNIRTRLDLIDKSSDMVDILKDFGLIKRNEDINLDFNFIKRLAEEGIVDLEARENNK